MTRFYLVRHGETDWNKNRRVMGCRDIPLNSKGMAQAKKVAMTFSRIHLEAIYTSPTKRTRETAEFICKHTGLEYIEDRRLIEIDMGPWEGMYFDDLLRRQDYRRFLVAPKDFFQKGVERMVDVQKRGVDLVEDVSQRHGNASIILLSHADVLRSILAFYLHIDLNYMRALTLEPGSISTIDVFSDRQGKVSLLNYTGSIG